MNWGKRVVCHHDLTSRVTNEPAKAHTAVSYYTRKTPHNTSFRHLTPPSIVNTHTHTASRKKKNTTANIISITQATSLTFPDLSLPMDNPKLRHREPTQRPSRDPPPPSFPSPSSPPALPELAVFVVDRPNHGPDQLQLGRARSHHPPRRIFGLYPSLCSLVFFVVFRGGNTLRPVRDHRPKLTGQDRTGQYIHARARKERHAAREAG